MQSCGIPAAAIAISKNRRLVHARAFGHQDLAKTKPVTPRNRFRIASNSKPITAVAATLLVERRRLKLEDRAFDLLSELRPPAGANVDPRLRTITIRQLLEHSGGFDSTKTDPQFDALRLASDAVLAPAGILRMQLGGTKASRRLADEVECWDDPDTPNLYSVYANDLRPCPTSYGGFSMEAIDAHGGWLASVIDLTRFLDAVGGEHGTQILRPETVRDMWARPNLLQYRNGGKFYALGWDVVPGKKIAGHNGANTFGTLSCVQRLPVGTTAAISFNRLPFAVDKAVIEIEGCIRREFGASAEWPDVDLYAQYG